MLEANPAAHAELLTCAAQAVAGVSPPEWDDLTVRQRDDLLCKGHAALVRAGGMSVRAWRGLPFLSSARSAALLAGASELGIPVGWIAPPRRDQSRASLSWEDSAASARPVTELTGREARTLRNLPASRLAFVTRRLLEGPQEGYLETGPGLRDTIARRVGRLVLHEVSAGKVVPLPDGIELPVTSSDYLVLVRLTVGGSYEVARVHALPGRETLEGMRPGLGARDIREAVWDASNFRSLGAGPGWAAGGHGALRAFSSAP